MTPRAWKFSEPLDAFSKMRTGFGISLVFSVVLVRCITAWNLLVDPRTAYSQLAMDQETRKLEIPLSLLLREYSDLCRDGAPEQ
jgi:hypothetical protein